MTECDHLLYTAQVTSLRLGPGPSPALFSSLHTWTLNCLEKRFSEWFKIHVCDQENGAGDNLGTRLHFTDIASENMFAWPLNQLTCSLAQSISRLIVHLGSQQSMFPVLQGHSQCSQQLTGDSCLPRAVHSPSSSWPENAETGCVPLCTATPYTNTMCERFQ